ncbi:MAG: ABC transporter permease [Chloroflexi bacterium GWB2_49_20]|nr:MAG: ABC transporter permease [Chloroflexi bacterium GWB2_49_20]OGN77196.1 MAG: ABC transporter permease [Chloroflexi bacterium GWC2_49_37]OGN83922.1 MAG: ABC transporter permease [Chloroflexi bacterium GWD2_49_16]
METPMQNEKIKIILNYLSNYRQHIPGVFFILVALFIKLVLTKSIEPEALTTFSTNINHTAIQIPNWVFNTRFALDLIAGLCAGLGLYQIIRGFKKGISSIIGAIGGLVVLGFLVWGASGTSISFTGMLAVMVIRSVPITIGALAGILSERAGIVNIAIEGMMIAGAFAGAVIGSILGLWAGILAAILIGALLGLVHAVLSIKYKVDQIISGTMINIFSTGLTSYLFIKFLQDSQNQWLNESGFFKPYAIPLLSKIPVIGPIFFDHNLFIYAMYFLVILLSIALFKTKWGLRHRSVGEHPKAADTLGVNVFRTRYLACVLSGMVAGFGGAYFSLGSVGRFEQTMTAGRGFIALAAMIFGNWNPLGALQAGMLFGFAESLTTKLSLLQFPIPAEVLLMLPYIITMVVLAGVVGRSRGPAADGIPYEKESL